MKSTKNKALAVAAMASAFLTPVANAGPIAMYDGPTINWGSTPACANFGDAVSCSLPFLNYLSGQAQGATGPSGYVVSSPQGALKTAIVIQAGGAAALDNSDTNPMSGSVENGFKSNSGSDQFLSTGKATGSTMLAGNMDNPTNNTLTAAQDNIGTWDVSTTWLRDALTTDDGKRHELMVMFDYNQSQSATASMNIWGLITVRDSTGAQLDKNFEFRETGNMLYSAFNTDKTFFSQPNGSEFETVSGTLCLFKDGTGIPYPLGNCPGTSPVTGSDLLQKIDNAQGTDKTEFAAFFPELNANLENYIAQGYDTVSVRLLMGCFDDTGNSKTGQGYLSGGATTQCDSGGFGDVYIMGGAVMTKVPEPTTLALAALGLLGGGLYRRQRKA